MNDKPTDQLLTLCQVEAQVSVKNSKIYKLAKSEAVPLANQGRLRRALVAERGFGLD